MFIQQAAPTKIVMIVLQLIVAGEGTNSQSECRLQFVYPVFCPWSVAAKNMQKPGVGTSPKPLDILGAHPEMGCIRHFWTARQGPNLGADPKPCKTIRC